MFTIQVIEKPTGKPSYYKKVGVSFNGRHEVVPKTNMLKKNGEAHFSEDNGIGTIYIQGPKVYEGKFEGKKNYSHLN